MDYTRMCVPVGTVTDNKYNYKSYNMEYKEKRRIREKRRHQEQERIRRNIERKRQRAFDNDLAQVYDLEVSKNMRNAWKCASFMANKYRQ